MPTTFDGFTLNNSINYNHYIIGYTDTNSKGEKRWTFDTVRTAVLSGFTPIPSPNGGTVKWVSGTGTPEGYVVAPTGSLYTNTTGGINSTLYVKESGSGSIGWVAK